MKPKVISWVLLGGIAGAIFGPLIIISTRGLFDPVMFAGNFAAAAGLTLVASAVVSLVDIPHEPQQRGPGTTGRPLLEILAQPRLIVAILCGMMAYGMMNLLMTATPLAMVACGFDVDDSAWVIQWHAVAMFLPSFFTGSLILRFGVERVIAAGMVLLASAAIVGLAGLTFGHFSIGLILLGLGWNFGFVGGTTMVTDCHFPAEKNKVQAVNDFCVFGTVATASLTSGALLNAIGWNAVNIAIFPMVALCCIGLGWLVVSARRAPATL